MAKLTNAQQSVLDMINEQMHDPALLQSLTKAVMEAKEANRKTSERGPRTISYDFTPRDASIMRMRLIDKVSQADIEEQLNVKTSTYNQAVRGAAWKILNLLLSEGVISNDQFAAVLTKHGVAEEKEKKSHDKVQEEVAAPHESADSVAASDDAIAAALAGE